MKTLFSLIIIIFAVKSNYSQSRDASFSKDGSKIVYVSKVEDKNQIFIANSNGSNPQQLTHLKNSCYYPFLSPDSSQIVFMESLDGKTLICLIDSNGENYKRLTSLEDDAADPSWSPDGNEIIFSSKKTGNNELYIMSLEGKKWVQLTNNEFSDQTPSISPVGEHVVFVSDRDGNNELYLMTLRNKKITRLTIDPRSDRVPRWSSDGKKIIWYSREPSKVAGSGKKSWNGAEIYEIEISGKNRKQITHNFYRDQSPALSPNGKAVMFTSKRTGKNEIYLIDKESSEVIQLTDSKN
ncbi:DPP IV N-terminal domain-containing protein [Winogradskyella sp. 3972H.M.0a.05]|uniref:DPP IV N-terminal domain-containing protein n=1 Tax=Winogradskyella sp. 3972H.M.0a.05 TaxID=2950277 RepID=UPI003396134E